MNRKNILKLSRLNGGNTKFNNPGSVYRKLLQDNKKYGIPLTNKDMAMISYLSIAFKFNEDINVLYNYIENDLFMVRFETISETDVDVDCNTCEGSGEYECSICYGTGEEDDEDCYNCNGTGETTCNDCNGNGYILDKNSVLKDIVTCFSYDRDYFNMFELNTSGFISSADYDIFLEDEKTIFITEDFGVLDEYNYQFSPEVGQSFIIDLIRL